MELLLNLVWFAVALMAFGALGVRAARESDRRRTAMLAVATLCAIAVLFPIISMSDDMQASVALVEQQHEQLQSARAAVAVLAITQLRVAPLVVLGNAFTRAFHLPASPATPAFGLRGPPSLGR